MGQMCLHKLYDLRGFGGQQKKGCLCTKGMGWPWGLREEQLWLSFPFLSFFFLLSALLCGDVMYLLWLVAVSLLYRCYELTSGQFVGSLTSDEQPVVFLKSM